MAAIPMPSTATGQEYADYALRYNATVGFYVARNYDLENTFTTSCTTVWPPLGNTASNISYSRYTVKQHVVEKPRPLTRRWFWQPEEYALLLCRLERAAKYRYPSTQYKAIVRSQNRIRPKSRPALSYRQKRRNRLMREKI